MIWKSFAVLMVVALPFSWYAYDQYLKIQIGSKIMQTQCTKSKLKIIPKTNQTQTFWVDCTKLYSNMVMVEQWLKICKYSLSIMYLAAYTWKFSEKDDFDNESAMLPSNWIDQSFSWVLKCWIRMSKSKLIFLLVFTITGTFNPHLFKLQTKIKSN